MSENETLLEFPCEFPIKVFGHHSDDFHSVIVALVRRHAPALQDEHVVPRASKGGKYLALTVTIEAHSKEQLDAIYLDLTACEHVVMAL